MQHIKVINELMMKNKLFIENLNGAWWSWLILGYINFILEEEVCIKT